MTDDLYREGDRLAGLIAEELYEEFWAKSRFRFGNPPADYELVGSEEYETDDPYLTVLRRESDGQHFEIEIEVMVRPTEPPERPAEVSGQEVLIP